MTVTATDTVPCAATLLNNDAKTVTVMVTTASVVPCQQESNLADKSSDSDGSQAVWVVVAILFLVIAVSAIVSSTFLGYLLHKKVKNHGNASTAASSTGTNRSVGEGKISNTQCICEATLTFGHYTNQMNINFIFYRIKTRNKI